MLIVCGGGIPGPAQPGHLLPARARALRGVQPAQGTRADYAARVHPEGRRQRRTRAGKGLRGAPPDRAAVLQPGRRLRQRMRCVLFACSLCCTNCRCGTAVFPTTRGRWVAGPPTCGMLLTRPFPAVVGDEPVLPALRSKVPRCDAVLVVVLTFALPLLRPTQIRRHNPRPTVHGLVLLPAKAV